MPECKEQLAQINPGSNFIPKISQVFSAFALHPESVKVCIVGQDPYPDPEFAMGMAFSVPSKIVRLPASLKNIFTELEGDLGIKNSNGDLTNWQEQGVLLLNRALTTNEGISKAHSKIGWYEFTESVVRRLATSDVIFLLWGREAQELAKFIPLNNVVAGPHPSPLSAYRGFFGSKPFSRINSLLEVRGLQIIDWRT